MIERFLKTHQSLSALRYCCSLLLTGGVAWGLSVSTFHYLGSHHHLVPLCYFLTIVYSIIAFCCILLLTLQRLNTLDKCGALTLLLLIPGVNVLFILSLLTAQRDGLN